MAEREEGPYKAQEAPTPLQKGGEALKMHKPAKWPPQPIGHQDFPGSWRRRQQTAGLLLIGQVHLTYIVKTQTGQPGAEPPPGARTQCELFEVVTDWDRWNSDRASNAGMDQRTKPFHPPRWV